MTVAGAIFAALLVVWAIRETRRRASAERWRLERQRIAEHDERRAAANGRPHGDVGAVTPARNRLDRR